MTQILSKSLETILSATNHYLILLKGILGHIIQLLYRYNSTSLAFFKSSTTMKPAAHLSHHHLVTCAWVCGPGGRARQTLWVWWRQEHSPSRIICRPCGDQGSRECALHGLDKKAPNGILKNKDFLKLHECLDEGEEALWFHTSAVGRAGCRW